MPNMYIIAGCNGAGKTTTAQTLLEEYLGCREFINADLIAAGTALTPGTTAIEAGKRTLRVVNKLIADGTDFAIETTLSGLVHRAIIRKARAAGFHISLLFIWLESRDAAMMRVASRVRLGGHDIPATDVLRRYGRGIVNLFDVYAPIVDYWAIIDNSQLFQQMVADGGNEIGFTIYKPEIYDTIRKHYNECKSQV